MMAPCLGSGHWTRERTHRIPNPESRLAGLYVIAEELTLTSDYGPIRHLVAVHLGVGKTDRLRQRVGILGYPGDADAQSRGRRQPRLIARQLEGQFQLARLRDRFPGVAVEEKQELVATPPDHVVGLAYVPAQ